MHMLKNSLPYSMGLKVSIDGYEADEEIHMIGGVLEYNGERLILISLQKE